jgi:predicted amidophosphoribosyltransferase
MSFESFNASENQNSPELYKPCPNCGMPTRPQDNFCISCKHKIQYIGKNIVQLNEGERQCPKCGAVVDSNNNFCIKCRYKLKYVM